MIQIPVPLQKFVLELVVLDLFQLPLNSGNTFVFRMERSSDLGGSETWDVNRLGRLIVEGKFLLTKETKNFADGVFRKPSVNVNVFDGKTIKPDHVRVRGTQEITGKGDRLAFSFQTPGHLIRPETCGYGPVTAHETFFPKKIPGAILIRPGGPRAYL
jgi:hypothetical protein